MTDRGSLNRHVVQPSSPTLVTATFTQTGNTFTSPTMYVLHLPGLLMVHAFAIAVSTINQTVNIALPTGFGVTSINGANLTAGGILFATSANTVFPMYYSHVTSLWTTPQSVALTAGQNLYAMLTMPVTPS